MDVDSKADYSQQIIEDYIDIMVRHGLKSKQALRFKQMYAGNPYISEAFEQVAEFHEIIESM